MFELKACVRYFLSNFYFSPNDSPLKTMKSAFYFICIFIFPSFFPCQPLLERLIQEKS